MHTTLEDAIELVLALARQNIDLTDSFDPTLEKCKDACDVLEDFMTKYLYEDAAAEHEYNQQFMT
jgi:hypothetical protein